MKLKYKKIKEKIISIEDKDTGYKKEIFVKLFSLPNSLLETFFIDKGKDSVCVFALTEDNKVVLVSQFRAGIEEVALELPGGGLDEDEDPLKAAIREMREETGYEGDVEFIASLPYGPYSTGLRHCYFARNCKKASTQNLDPNEFLEVVLMDLPDFKDLALSGKVRGFEVALLAMAREGLKG